MSYQPEYRDCPIPGCQAKAKMGHLMCRRHWSMVPGALKRDVHSTWNLYLDAKGPARLMNRRPYLTAVDRAVASVTMQLEGV